MSLRRTITVTGIAWLAAITFAHLWLNLEVFASKPAGEAQDKFRIGFLPVT